MADLQAGGLAEEGWQQAARSQDGMNGFDGITGGISSIQKEAAFSIRSGKAALRTVSDTSQCIALLVLLPSLAFMRHKASSC